jgi:hypothetical protein
MVATEENTTQRPRCPSWSIPTVEVAAAWPVTKKSRESLRRRRLQSGGTPDNHLCSLPSRAPSHGQRCRGGLKQAQSDSWWWRTPPESIGISRKWMAVARVVKGKEGREKRRQGSEWLLGADPALPLHGRKGTLHDQQALYPSAKGAPPRSSRAVLSTVVQQQMERENSILPLARKQNHGGTTAPLVYCPRQPSNT